MRGAGRWGAARQRSRSGGLSQVTRCPDGHSDWVEEAGLIKHFLCSDWPRGRQYRDSGESLMRQVRVLGCGVGDRPEIITGRGHNWHQRQL